MVVSEEHGFDALGAADIIQRQSFLPEYRYCTKYWELDAKASNCHMKSTEYKRRLGGTIPRPFYSLVCMKKSNTFASVVIHSSSIITHRRPRVIGSYNIVSSIAHHSSSSGSSISTTQIVTRTQNTPTMMKRSLLFLLQATSCLAFSSPAGSSSKIVPVRRSSSLSSSTTNGDKNPFDFLQSLFSSPSSAVAEPEPQIPDVVVESDYTLAAVFGVVGVSIVAANHGVGGVVGGGFITLLASLFAVQAGRIRFVFDKDCFELKTVGEDDLNDSGENIVVGGANRWAYTSFVNWDFFPSADFPILVYFKETQTPQADGSDEGQVHFFPAIANVKQLKDQFELRGCASVKKD